MTFSVELSFYYNHFSPSPSCPDSEVVVAASSVDIVVVVDVIVGVVVGESVVL